MKSDVRQRRRWRVLSKISFSINEYDLSGFGTIKRKVVKVHWLCWPTSNSWLAVIKLLSTESATQPRHHHHIYFSAEHHIWIWTKNSTDRLPESISHQAGLYQPRLTIEPTSTDKLSCEGKWVGLAAKRLQLVYQLPFKVIQVTVNSNDLEE